MHLATPVTLLLLSLPPSTQPLLAVWVDSSSFSSSSCATSIGGGASPCSAFFFFVLLLTIADDVEVIIDVDEPRHAVVSVTIWRHVIAKTLEQHLNEVTPDTSTHEIIQKCLRIVRVVTEDDNLYVRSQRRRCTDQP
ncbi:hypothetical protein GmHk_15G042413 [Glycine max]|nr:hypothetical protein GmHk_15G042413 [Glycine max]